MTTTDHPTRPPTPPTGAVGDLRAVGTPVRAVLVLLAVTGPLAVAALRAVLPYSTADGPAGIAAAVAAHPGAQSAALWLGYLALLTLPLGVLLTGRAAAAARPVLGTAAAALSWAGFTSLFWLTATDQLALAGAVAGTPGPVLATLLAGLEASPVATVAAVAFVAGHILGTVLLGLALWRVLPRLAAAALTVSQPLHLVFAVLLPNPWLDAAAWALTAVGFGAAALRGGAR